MSMSRRFYSRSVLHEADLNVLRSHLPEWEVNAVEGGFRCKSIPKTMNDEEWADFFAFIKKHFGEDFQEVYHYVNTGHRDFVIYVQYPE